MKPHHDTTGLTTSADSTWTEVARLQGLVCIVCGEPPKLQRRAEFYDSGLCRACAAEIESDGAAPSA